MAAQRAAGLAIDGLRRRRDALARPAGFALSRSGRPSLSYVCSYLPTRLPEDPGFVYATVGAFAYATLCRTCRIYQTFGRGQRIPVLSLLSAGGGPPVISSSVVSSDATGKYVVVLPTSPGTSGSPVLDLSGNLVGIVVTAAVYRGAEASWTTGIVLGSTVGVVMQYAVAHLSQAASSPPASSQPSTAPSVPSPAPAPSSSQSGSSALQRTLPSLGSVTVVRSVTARGVQSNQPQDETASFSATDAIYVYVRMSIPRVGADAAGKTVPLVWRWTAPSGEIIEQSASGPLKRTISGSGHGGVCPPSRGVYSSHLERGRHSSSLITWKSLGLHSLSHLRQLLLSPCCRVPFPATGPGRN